MLGDLSREVIPYNLCYILLVKRKSEVLPTLTQEEEIILGCEDQGAGLPGASLSLPTMPTIQL